MSYLVAYVPGARGCMAMEINAGTVVAYLVSCLSQQTQGVEILTVHDADTYGEYAPYEVVPLDDFIWRVIMSYGCGDLRDRIRMATQLESMIDMIRRVADGFGVSEEEALRVLGYEK